MTAPLIEIKNLSFYYEKVPILENIDLTVKKGEFLGIFGPNGGGKTTLLKLLLGFLKPARGEIRLFGKSPKIARPHLGYVPQAMRFDKQFPISVLEVILMGCLHKLSWWGTYPKAVKKEALEILEKVGLADKRHQAFGTLSGGQAQRVLIARALASNPELLLLDEPTANVDPQAEEEIYTLLMQLKHTKTILMVTHDLQTMIHRAERFLCVRRQLTSFLPKDLCEHFALGLYHPPLIPQPFKRS